MSFSISASTVTTTLTLPQYLTVPIIDAAISVQVPNGTDVYDTATRGVELGVFMMNTAQDLDSYPGNTSFNSTHTGPNSTFVKEYVGIVWPGYTYFPDWWANNTQQWWTEAFKNMSEFMDFDGYAFLLLHFDRGKEEHASY